MEQHPNILPLQVSDYFSIQILACIFTYQKLFFKRLKLFQLFTDQKYPSERSAKDATQCQFNYQIKNKNASICGLWKSPQSEQYSLYGTSSTILNGQTNTPVNSKDNGIASHYSWFINDKYFNFTKYSSLNSSCDNEDIVTHHLRPLHILNGNEAQNILLIIDKREASDENAAGIQKVGLRILQSISSHGEYQVCL